VKICNRCGAAHSSRKHAWCTPCGRAYQRERRVACLAKWEGKDPYTEHRTGFKRCASCRTTHPVTAFGTNRGYKDGLATYCKACMRDAQRKTTHGVDRPRLDRLLHAQGGACALCRDPFDVETRRPRTRFNVDHDHNTGEVRGLLCVRCNSALGVFGDGEEGVLRALAYLRSPPARGVP
jgi:hypothetical protein